MTLLLALRTPDHIVMISDGLSFRLDKKELAVTRSDLPKQFAIEGLPVVIAHHGQNVLGTVPVEQIIASDRFQDLVRDAWTAGLNRVLGESILELDGPVTQSLEAAKLRENFGLWFAGLWTCTDKPDIAELMWVKKSYSQTRINCHPLNDISYGGSGVKFLSKRLKAGFDNDDRYPSLRDGRPESAMEFLKALYREALQEQKQAGETLFGGQAMISLTSRDGVDIGPVDIGIE